MKFEGKLEIGGLAMIIGCSKPDNSWVIGSVVTVEAILEKGDSSEQWYDLPEGKRIAPVPHPVVVVSGCKITGKSMSQEIFMRDGHAFFKPHNLMPLPPLDEKELEEERELEMSH